MTIDGDVKKLSQASRLLDMMFYLSRVRTVTASALARRYNVSRATVIRDIKILESEFRVPFCHSPGKPISVSDGWEPKLVRRRSETEIRALEIAIENQPDPVLREALERMKYE